MTPHILLLTGLASNRFMITVQAIATIEPGIDGTTLIYDLNGAAYEAKESFDSIMMVLGGLVMKPFSQTQVPKDLR